MDDIMALSRRVMAYLSSAVSAESVNLLALRFGNVSAGILDISPLLNCNELALAR